MSAKRVVRTAVHAFVVVAGVGSLAAGAWFVARPDSDATGARASLSVVDALGRVDTAGYARADTPRAFTFPRDHGPHPGFRTEWWYLTGSLVSEDGRRFGYQLTFFRNALRSGEGESGSAGSDGRADARAAGPPSGGADLLPPDREERSRWRTRQGWMAHFTVTDVEAGAFHAFERFDRGALGLAGASTDPPLRVWTGPWEVDGRRLRAEAEGVSVDLRLGPFEPVVLQGEAGWSRKGPGPGNASYYYSVPRIATSGSLRTPDGTFRVEGTTWLDREWSTSALPDGVVGWDWFGLQLEDGRDLMIYLLRRTDGSPTRFSGGVILGPDGTRADLSVEDLSVRVLDTWASESDGVRYPSGWRVTIPDHDLDVRVVPVLRGQELALSFRYWEGAVDVFPFVEGAGDVGGRGYVELTGYAGTGRGRSLVSGSR